jgi:hypothetical protein
MTPTLVLYRLESQRAEGDPWNLVLDEDHEPLTFSGPSGKAKARNMGKLLCRYPSFVGLRVMRNDEPIPVWMWVKQASAYTVDQQLRKGQR